MGRVIDQHDRQQLQDAGLWGEYRRYYGMLKDAGEKPAVARERALGLLRKVMEGALSVNQLYDADGRVASPEEVSSKSDPALMPRPSAPVFSDEAIALLRRKKSVRPMLEFRWVLRNIDEPEVDLVSCPDYEAWKILRYCQENPAMFRDLLAEYERRGFSRDNGEDRRDAPLDGDEIIADIDKLRKAGVVR